ncbi:MAG: histidine kinase dimerization/phosphoacceptor domain -containing protein [Pseudomonadota bacterium]
MTLSRDPTVYYRDIVNSIDDALLVVDPSLTVLYANLAYYQLFADTEEETLGKPIFAADPEIASNDKLMSLLSAVAEHGVTVDNFTFEENFPIIGSRTFTVSARRIKRDAVSTNRTVVVVRDVTESARKRAETTHAIERGRTQLLEVNHRVKNNLGSVLAVLRLERRALADSEAAAILERIALRVESIASLYELLTVSDSASTVELLSYVGRVCLSIEKVSSNTKPDWAINVAGEPFDVSVDAAVNIGVVVNELVANAAKYAFRGRDHGGHIEVTLRREDDALLLTIADDGIGLQERVPEPKSTGLGMRLVSLYLAAMNGEMSRESWVGKGTTYTLRIPVSATEGEGSSIYKSAPDDIAALPTMALVGGTEVEALPVPKRR